MLEAVEVDTTDFDAAMSDYMRYTRKTLAETINRKLGDWAFEASRLVPVASKAAIQGLATATGAMGRGWWKFINTVIHAGFLLHGRRKATDEEAAQGYTDRATGKHIERRKTVGFYRNTATNFKKKDYSRVSKLLIRRRIATLKSFVGQFLYSAHLMGKNVVKVGGGKQAWKTHGIVARMAEVSDVKAAAALSIPFRARTLENKRHEGALEPRQRGKLAIAQRALNAARDRVVADMRQYINNKLAAKAKSPRAA